MPVKIKLGLSLLVVLVAALAAYYQHMLGHDRIQYIVAFLGVSAADWASFATQVVASAQTGKSLPIGASAAKFFAFAPFWVVIVGMLMYPALEAITMRWRLSGLRFGDIAFASGLRTGSVYWIFLRYILAMILLAMARPRPVPRSFVEK